MPIAPNELARQFQPEAPKRVWVGDITYLRVGKDNWSYLSVLMDLHSRRIVGYSLEGLLIHHDRGVQYASDRYRWNVNAMGARLSMSRKSNYWDNAPCESFFATLKAELGCMFDSMEQAQQAICEYINWYNTQRIHCFNKGGSPLEKELAAYRMFAA